MSRLSIEELTSGKLSNSIVETLSAIKGGTQNYCHCDGNKNGTPGEPGDYGGY